VARRLASLLVIALACGFGAVTVSGARAGKSPAPIAHIPAIPATVTACPRCPVPTRFRKAFVDAAAPSDETLTYVADVTSIWRSLAGCT